MTHRPGTTRRFGIRRRIIRSWICTWTVRVGSWSTQTKGWTWRQQLMTHSVACQGRDRIWWSPSMDPWGRKVTDPNGSQTDHLFGIWILKIYFDSHKLSVLILLCPMIDRPTSRFGSGVDSDRSGRVQSSWVAWDRLGADRDGSLLRRGRGPSRVGLGHYIDRWVELVSVKLVISNTISNRPKSLKKTSKTRWILLSLSEKMSFKFSFKFVYKLFCKLFEL